MLTSRHCRQKTSGKDRKSLSHSNVKMSYANTEEKLNFREFQLELVELAQKRFGGIDKTTGHATG